VTVGFLIAHSPIAVFIMFGICYLIYGIVIILFGEETKGMQLEEAALEMPHGLVTEPRR